MTLDELILGLKDRVVVLTKEEVQLRLDLTEAERRYDEVLRNANDWRALAESLKNECIRLSTKTAQVLHPLWGEECMPNRRVRYCGQCGHHVKDQRYCSNCGRELIWENIYDKSMECRARAIERVKKGREERERREQSNG